MPNRHLDRPELPNVCITCGEAGGLAPRKLEFGYVSRRDKLLAMLLSLLGFLYHRETAYRLRAPMCARCANYHRWSKVAFVLMFPGVFAAMLAAFAATSDPVPIIALPSAVLVATFVSYVVLRAKGEPKVVEVTDRRLVVSIPHHGEFAVYDEAPAALEFTRSPRTTTTHAPRLNRSVCGGCGFINFAGAADCKKCASPLGSSAVA